LTTSTSARHANEQGRPYTATAIVYIIGLLGKYTLSATQKILNDASGSWSILRDRTIIRTPINISYPTLMKIADDANIKRKRGRPKKS